MGLIGLKLLLIPFHQLRVNTVYEKGQTKYLQQDSLEETGGSYMSRIFVKPLLIIRLGTNLNAASRQALLQKLMRTENPSETVEPVYVHICPS